MQRPLISAGFGLWARLFGGLALLLLLAVVGCSENTTPTTVSPSPQLTAATHAFPRNHVPPSGSHFLVYVRFTSQTTYEQAEQALREKTMYHFPMVQAVPCGELRVLGLLDPTGSPCPVGTPMTTGQLQADFSQSHRMLAFSISQELLNQLATDARVVSIDAYPLPK